MDFRALLQCLLLLGAVAAAPSNLERVRRSSNSTSPQSRIVGGEPVLVGELKYVCGVVQDNNLYCGCSIIALHYAITSATCETTVPNPEVGVKLVAGDLRVDEGTSFPVRRIIPHPKFNPDTNDFDLAILETSSPMLGPNIEPIVLAPANFFLRDHIMYVVPGWGSAVPQGPQSPVLLKANVRKFPQGQCQADYNAVEKIITPRMVCAAAVGRDTCQGDYGSPLVYQHRLHVDDTPSLFDVQVGIASFDNGCGDPAFPGVYTRITDEEIRDFITDTANV